MKNYTSILLQSSLIVATAFGTNSCTNTSAEERLAISEYSTEENFEDTNPRDTEFLVHVAEVNREEIFLGKLAQQKGNIKQVKELGEIMEVEHTKSLAELTTLANNKNILVITSQSQKDQDAYNKLNEKSGSTFDKEYCNMVVTGHQNAIESFEKAAIECKDEDIRDWATATLPALKRNLDHSLKCQKECKKSDHHLLLH